ncbi:GBF-interacting protein 1, N-terminal [Dillenia turbinata]|uniref:GBF-interacting protein 1, N-terminal n=1 Tax=Dillenia turbinata TaxID=194707 RepID=A0AAN8VLU5_9MAGN
MGSRGGSNVTNGKANNNGGGPSGIPASARKLVQSLKEIVNCSEQEIYAMLKECDMNPDDAVNRLLSQDPFHEVKSKRDKKKENKDTMESRSCGTNNTSNRGRSGMDHNLGRGCSSQVISSDPGFLHSKPAYKKENGPTAYQSSSGSGMPGYNTNRWFPSQSDSAVMESKISTMGFGDVISSSSQPASGYQPAWIGVPGQRSMADIVKMGIPQGRVASAPNPSHHNANHRHASVTSPIGSSYDLCSAHSHASNVSDLSPQPGVVMSQHITPDDDWPLDDQQPAASVAPYLEPPTDTELYAESSHLPLDSTDQHLIQSDEGQVVEDGDLESNTSVSSGKVPEEPTGSATIFDKDLYNNMNSYHTHMHAFEHQEVEDVAATVSSVSANFQQLSLEEEDQGPPLEDEGRSVVIPDHLQVQSGDCSHLSFGSFGSGIKSAFSSQFASMPVNTNIEEASAPGEASSSTGQSESRNSEYYGDGHLRTTSDGNSTQRTSVSAGNYDSPSVSQTEVLKPDILEAAQGNQYNFPSSMPGYSLENSQQLNAALAHSQMCSQMQNLAPFSSVMQSYTNSLPSTLLGSNAHVRESDNSYSPFSMTQSLPTKYCNPVTSISSSTLSVPEMQALKSGSFSSAQPTPQTLPSTTVATGPALPQHLAVHPYTPPTLPLGPFPSMLGYPYLPQSYTYLPSAFQQAYAGNSTYHQSLAAMLPQYKNSVSVSSLPQSAAVASGYGAFGNSANIPANFPLNPPAASVATSRAYDDIISSQYKDSSHLLSLQQNDNSALWDGPGSRTMFALPASTFYSFQGQNQQPAGFRQGQQPSQHYGAGALGFPNFYHSQTGISPEHQQQNPREGSLGGSQGQPPKHSQQIWQNNY